MELLIMCNSGHSLPVNVIKKGVRSDFYVALPGSLLMGEVAKIISTSKEGCEGHCCTFQALVADLIDREGKIVPRHVMNVVCRRRDEKHVLSTLMRTLSSYPALRPVLVYQH